MKIKSIKSKYVIGSIKYETELEMEDANVTPEFIVAFMKKIVYDEKDDNGQFVKEKHEKD